MTEEITAPQRAWMPCPSCGMPSQDGTAFCANCGAALAGGPVVRHGLFRRLWATRPSPKILVAGLVTIGLVFLASFFGVAHARNAPVRDALDRTSGLVGPVHAEAAQADSIDDLLAAVGEYDGLSDAVERARADVSGRRGDFAAAAKEVMVAQRELATAAAGLTSVPAGDVTAWGDARATYLAAIDVHAKATSTLAQEDDGRADAAVLPRSYADTVRSLLDQAVLGAAGESIEKSFSMLAEAETTSDLRALGSEAGDAEGALRSVMQGFDDGSAEHVRLESLAGLYEALSAMSVVDAEHLDDWADVRKGIVEATGALQADDRSLSGGSRSALGDADAMIAKARTTLRNWRSEHTAAVDKKAADLKTITDYDAVMNTQLQRYGVLRASLSTFIDRVDDPSDFVTYSEAYDVLWRAETDRIAVRDAMNELVVPASMSGRHSELVAVIDNAILAVSSGYRGLSDAEYCTFACYYKDTPGWARFSSESARITDVFAQAVEAWEVAVVDAQTEAENRVLPERPEV